MFGIESKRAENGQICVDLMREAEEGSYDLIFMDVQMPQMNGLEATRAIRGLSNSWAASIPIVAMTADAFSENVTISSRLLFSIARSPVKIFVVLAG